MARVDYFSACCSWSCCQLRDVACSLLVGPFTHIDQLQGLVVKRSTTHLRQPFRTPVLPHPCWSAPKPVLAAAAAVPLSRLSPAHFEFLTDLPVPLNPRAKTTVANGEAGLAQLSRLSAAARAAQVDFFACCSCLLGFDRFSTFLRGAQTRIARSRLPAVARPPPQPFPLVSPLSSPLPSSPHPQCPSPFPLSAHPHPSNHTTATDNHGSRDGAL